MRHEAYVRRKTPNLTSVNILITITSVISHDKFRLIVKSFSGDLHEILFDVLIFVEMECNGKNLHDIIPLRLHYIKFKKSFFPPHFTLRYVSAYFLAIIR